MYPFLHEQNHDHIFNTVTQGNTFIDKTKRFRLNIDIRREENHNSFYSKTRIIVI